MTYILSLKRNQPMTHNNKVSTARDAMKTFALKRHFDECDNIDIPVHNVSQMVYDFDRELTKLQYGYFCCPYDEQWCHVCEDEKLNIIDNTLFTITKKMRILLSMTFGKNWARTWLRKERHIIREMRQWYPTLLAYSKAALYRLHMLDKVFRYYSFDYTKMEATQ